MKADSVDYAKTVLIADDDDKERNFIVSHIESLGYRTVSADSGQKALDIFTQLKIDLIIWDVDLPLMPGVELLLVLKNIRPETSIIVITDYLPTPIQRMRLSIKVDAFLEKPISLFNLTKTVKSLTDRSIKKQEENAQEINLSKLRKKRPNKLIRPEEEKLDLNRFLQLLLLHKWVFIILVSLSLLLSFFYMLKYRGIFYETTFEVFFLRSEKPLTNDAEVPMITSDFNTTFWLGVMNSEEIARKTLENSGFEDNSIDFIKRIINSELMDKRDTSNPVYKVTVTSNDNSAIPLLSRAYITALNDYIINFQIESSEKLVTYFINQLAVQNDNLLQIDRELLSEQKTNPYLTRDFSKLSTDLESYRKDLMNAQIELSSVKASRKHAESQSAFSEPLKDSLVRLNVELAQALTDKTEAHPTVVAIRNNITQITRMLVEEIEQTSDTRGTTNVRTSSQSLSNFNELEIKELSLETRVRSLQKVISDLERQMFPDTTDEQQQLIVRNRELVLMKIGMINARLLDVQSSAHANLNRFVMIDDPPIPDKTAGRRVSFYLLVGLFIGLSVGAVGVYVYDMIDRRFVIPADLEQYENQLSFGEVYHKKDVQDYFRNPNRISRFIGHDNEIRETILNIKKHLTKTGTKTIFVCSPVREEGKSLISMLLATGLADKELNTLIVDTDVYNRKISRLFKKDDKLGFSDYILGRSSFQEIVYPTNNDYLMITPAGYMDKDLDFKYHEEACADFVEKAYGVFDVVLFDTPAALFIPEVENLLDFMDLVLVVVRLGLTTHHSYEKVIDMIDLFERPTRGIIINGIKTNLINNRYGYRDYYYYPSKAKNQQIHKDRLINDIR